MERLFCLTNQAELWRNNRAPKEARKWRDRKNRSNLPRARWPLNQSQQMQKPADQRIYGLKTGGVTSKEAFKIRQFNLPYWFDPPKNPPKINWHHTYNKATVPFISRGRDHTLGNFNQHPTSYGDQDAKKMRFVCWNWDVGAEFRISIKKPELQGLRP